MASFTGLPYPRVRRYELLRPSHIDRASHPDITCREHTPDIDDIFRGHPIPAPAVHDAAAQQQQRDPYQLRLERWITSSHSS